MLKLYAPPDAAQVLGVNYSTLKQMDCHGKLKSVQTRGSHHRIPESEVDHLLPRINVGLSREAAPYVSPQQRT